jgi:replicative DNA helicase Mcm
MPQKEFTLDEIESLVEYVDVYQRDEYDELVAGYPKDKSTFFIDWVTFWEWDHNHAQDALIVPSDYRNGIADALDRYDRKPVDVDLSDVDVRFTNVDETKGVAEIRKDDAQKLIGIDGQISKVSAVRPRVKTAAWRCKQCNVMTEVECRERIEEPDDCDGCGNQGPFDLDAPESEIVNHQLIRIKQPPEEAADGGGGEHIDAHIEGDEIVGTASAGERAEVTGVLELELGDMDNPDLDWYHEVDAIDVPDDDYAEINISEYREQIEQYASQEGRNPFELVTESVAPSISGGDEVDVETPWGETYPKYWWVRFGIALGTLFGGWRKPNHDGTYQRGTSHVLLMGDPSTGKSSIMNAVENLAPRSAFESGENASGAGLTAAAVQDDFGDSQFSLEAGALVKAHNGVACVDEIDKMKKESLNRMHSALEKQRLEFNKGGIDATLKCETALLASGNPENSRFNDVDTNQSQIDIVSSLLDRFDLVYVLKDKPEKERDRSKAEKVIQERAEAGLVDKGVIDQDDATTGTPAVPEEVMRSWIALARREYEPIISDEVEERLAEYYADIRSEGEGDNDPVPATIRNLKGLLRLAEASARLRLSETVELIDAEIAIAVTKVSLNDIGYDPETGKPDVDFASGRGSYSQTQRREKLKAIVETLETHEAGADPEEVIDMAVEANMSRDKAKSEFESMKTEGVFYGPKRGEIRKA